MQPNKGRPYGDPELLDELVSSAKRAGLVGLFLWDHIGGSGNSPTRHPWIYMAAIVSHTHSMRLVPRSK
jgi:alkanesulfonate monooxygenase SsuD/methylene tetrahydromethanopterin reductase-like flavin-dependent oxidoreductase (luciferase family)